MELHRKPETSEIAEVGASTETAAHSPLDADCSPGNELVQCVLSDVPLGLSKVAAKFRANYTLYASHSRDVLSSGVQLALDRAYFGSSADTIPQHLDVVVRHELRKNPLFRNGRRR